MAVAHREKFAVVQIVNLAVHHHPGRPMALDTGLTRRGLRGRTHQRAPCYAYASLGELEFPVHCGGEADIRQVVTSTIRWQIFRHILAVTSTSFLAVSHYAWRRFHP